MKEINKKNSVIIWTIISIILAIIYTIVCKKLDVYQNSLYIERTICVFGFIEFIGLHIVIGFKNLWDFIIEKRYIIALVCLLIFTFLGINGSSMGAITNWILEPNKNNTVLGTYRFIRSDEYAVDTLLTASQLKNGFGHFSNYSGNSNTDMFVNIYVPIKSILSLFRIYNIGYLIPNFSMAYSFVGNFKLIASILITYEFFCMITNKKKYLSVIGTVLVISSSFVNWWFRETIDIIALGELGLIALDKYMLSTTTKRKLLWSTILSYSITSYILILYPAWLISFGYIFFAIGIWIIIKNRKDYKFQLIDVFCFIEIVLVIFSFGIIFYNVSYDAIKTILGTSYPGARNENGGKGIEYLFSYLYSIYLPFTSNTDTMKYASFFSLFPIPLIMGMIYIYKKEKHIDFILPLLIVLCFESIWCMSGFPEFIAKITLFNKVPVERCAVSVGLGLVYLYIYMFANIDEKFIKQTNCGYISLAILIILFFVPLPAELDTRNYLNIFVMIEAGGSFILLNMGDKKYKNVFLTFGIIMTLISGITVNPIAKGVGPITKTDFAKAVQAEVNKNPNEIWITENMDMVVSNYLVAQGAKTLNATQTYPNEEFWKEVLDNNKEEYRDTWNRYCHIRVLLTDNDSSVALSGQDKIVLNLNQDKLEELNVKYIVSYDENLEEKVNVKKIYSKKAEKNTNIEGNEVSGIYIYEYVN